MSVRSGRPTHAPVERCRRAADPAVHRGIARLALVAIVLVVVAGPVLGQPSARIDVFDANRAHTGGILLPLDSPNSAALKTLTEAAWESHARPVGRAAADGATLLLLRARLPGGLDRSPRSAGPTVEFTLQPANDGAAPGGLFPIDGRGLVDTSKAGGELETQPAGAIRLSVPTYEVGGARWAYALYRSPRNFDNPRMTTASMNGRGVGVTVGGRGVKYAATSITVVRPLVILVHGTVNNPGNWAPFPIWKNGGNELNDFRIPRGGVPFQVDRVSYQWIALADGPIVDNGRTVVEQIQRSLENWRRVTRTAGTQVDVATHSYGGPVARQAAQTQPDPFPLTVDGVRNFRAGTNWGHGAYHKLVTFAGSHRGSGWINAFAFINKFGRNGPGAVRTMVGETTGIDLGAGAPRDEITCSKALMDLKAAFFPSHAFVGSGMLSVEGAKSYAPPFTYEQFQTYDAPDGPFQSVGNAVRSARSANRLSNYTFNLDYDTPRLGPAPAYAVTPDTDLIVPERSGTGRLPRRAVTTVMDLDPSGKLVGHLSHSEFLASGASRKNPPNGVVSQRFVTLLQQPTTSRWFARFPANRSIPLDAAERDFTTRKYKGQLMFDPAYLELGAAPPAPPPLPNPGFEEIRVYPSRLVLNGTTPSPLLVYGRNKGGAWTFIQSLSAVQATSAGAPSAIWCKLTATSSKPEVVDLQVQPVVEIPVPVAKGVGEAVLTVSVETCSKKVLVPVTVLGFPVEARLVRDVPVREGCIAAAFISSAGFDAKRLVPESTRANGHETVAFDDGPTVRFVDVNGDGRADAVVQMPREALVFRAGLAPVRLQAAWRHPSYPADQAAFVLGTLTAHR